MPAARQPPASAAMSTMTATTTRRVSDGVFSKRSKQAVEINIDGQDGVFVPRYTTYDTISGNVRITPEYDVEFDDISIAFKGCVNTFIDRPSAVTPTNLRSTGKHTFIYLKQPLQIPEAKVLKTGITYSFPFTFVVPPSSLPTTCLHPRKSAMVHEAHTSLPPSLGDPSVSGNGTVLLDDMAPDMLRVAYAVHADVLRRKSKEPAERGKSFLDSVLQGRKKLQVIPMVEEQPPMIIPRQMSKQRFGDNFIMRREMDTSKGILPFLKKSSSGGGGKLVVEVVQPRPFHLPSPQTASPETTGTMVTVSARFEPSDPSQLPPHLQNIKAKLAVVTYFSAHPRQDIATVDNTALLGMAGGMYKTSTSLLGGHRDGSNLQWSRHDETDTRRTSTTSSSSSASSLDPSSTYKPGSVYYTTKLLIPLSLPTETKAFVPTFHHCLGSRTYSIDMSLSFQSSKRKTGVFASSTSLRIPVQVASRGKSLTDASSSTTLLHDPLTAAEAAETEAFFNPRLISPPDAAYTEHATLTGRLSISSSTSASSNSTSATSVHSADLPGSSPYHHVDPAERPPGYAYGDGGFRQALLQSLVPNSTVEVAALLEARRRSSALGEVMQQQTSTPGASLI